MRKMKNLLTICLFMLSSSSVVAQQMTLNQWNEEAKTNIRCLPKYGHVEKTTAQLEADSKFIQIALSGFANKRLASDHLIELGFKYLYHDVKTAMYRFNQAYLLDSTNSDIYWGYGAVYMILQDYPRAKEQYEEGLLHDSVNTRILTDYGTYFMVQVCLILPFST
jgi:tetratricopeptide (TPR) repeat protein